MNRKTFILLSAALLLFACKKGEDAPTREEYIKVYETSVSKTVDNIQVPFDGAQDAVIHVLSNVPLQWKYTISPNEADREWLTIKSVEEIEPGHWLVTYDAKSILELNSLERREGKLSFSCPEASLGKFLSIRQGFTRQFIETFDDKDDQTLVITGKETFTAGPYPVLNQDYFDYIAFNAWAETTNEFLSKNITLDVTVSGGHFYDIEKTTYRINVPIGTGASKDNLNYLLVMGDGERMSAKTTFTFSTANDDQVYVHIDNFAAYKVTEAEWGELFEEQDFEEDEQEDWI